MKDPKSTGETLPTEVTFDEIFAGIKDVYGGIYSKDGRRILKYVGKAASYEIKEGTKVICDDAFSICGSLRSIIIPDSVTSIGSFAFIGCNSLQDVTLSQAQYEEFKDIFREGVNFNIR